MILLLFQETEPYKTRVSDLEVNQEGLLDTRFNQAIVKILPTLLHLPFPVEAYPLGSRAKKKKLIVAYCSL